MGRPWADIASPPQPEALVAHAEDAPGGQAKARHQRNQETRARVSRPARASRREGEEV